MVVEVLVIVIPVLSSGSRIRVVKEEENEEGGIVGIREIPEIKSRV